MPTVGVRAPFDRGTHYGLHARFGTFEVTPLLLAARSNLPPGCVLRFVNPTNPHVKAYLKLHGRTVGRFLWRPRDFDLEVAASPDRVHDLADVTRAHGVKGLAVWFMAYDTSRHLVLECEDSNDYLWLSDSLPKDTRVLLVDSVGGSKSTIEGSPPTLYVA